MTSEAKQTGSREPITGIGATGSAAASVRDGAAPARNAAAEQSEALERAERRQGAFLSMLAHELRNPLAPIANAASVLRTLEDRNPVLGRLREILERQVARLGRMIDELSDVARAAQGQVALVNETLAVETLVRAAVVASASEIEGAGHVLEVETPPEPMHVQGDPGRLTQALSHLIANAAKFTREPATIALTVRASPAHVEIAVSDPGVGIAPEFLPHVFELFAQQEQAAGRKTGGLGIGLTLARRIVQLHGGDIEAFSEGTGRGARFVLRLPRGEASGASAASIETPALTPSCRVLLVEDEDAFVESTRSRLEQWGHEVRVADSAAAALDAIESFRPRLVLCNLAIDGLDDLGRLGPLRRKLGGQRTRFVAVIGSGREDSAARALAAGYDSVLTKPLQGATLARLLQACA